MHTLDPIFHDPSAGKFGTTVPWLHSHTLVAHRLAIVIPLVRK